MVIQGRELELSHIEQIRQLMDEHPDWHRTRISRELCELWDWRNQKGRIKDMAARTLLLKLERRGFIHLPERRNAPVNALRNLKPADAQYESKPIKCALREIRPLTITQVVSATQDLKLFNCLLQRYHYLGHRNTVGENMRYLVRDYTGRPIACALFGAAAWSCADRDQWIGWDQDFRKRNLSCLTNNTRFLILPWVEVPCLASHLLSVLVRRIDADWQEKYGHQIHALETFVDRSRFLGTCYKAANWVRLGETKGRTRNEKRNQMITTIKDIYLYPLTKDFRRRLCQ